MRHVHLTLLAFGLAIAGCNASSDDSKTENGSEEPAKPGSPRSSETPDGIERPNDQPQQGAPAIVGEPPPGFVFSPYKDTGIGMNWNTNVISSEVTGTMTELGPMLTAKGAKSVTLAFATGECGVENWGGVPGDTLASVNVPLLVAAGVDYIVSTGGAAGAFTCESDSGFETFLGRWSSAHLRGVDFDIEAGQSDAAIENLAKRIKSAHVAHPSLRFSLTLATLANNDGASTATSLGASTTNGLNQTGNATIAAVRSALGVGDTEDAWPSYVTVNLMTMDYGGASSNVCVVVSGKCDMGQSAIQAAHNLHDSVHVPYSAIELTPMLGMNDVTDEHFRLEDVDTITQFAVTKGLAGIHYWSFDRDRDCADNYASSTCNSMGKTYASPLGYLGRFRAAGLE